jgi:hypothetical protein
MQVQQYRKKPVAIEAIQQNGNTIELIKEWLGDSFDYYHSTTGTLYIKTLEGVMRGSTGDYIIKGVKGEFYPCKPDIFEATYEKV